MLEWERIETKWKERDFQDWLTDQEKSQDGDLRKAIAFIRKAHDLGEEADWPLEARRCVSLIDEALFRGKHAQMSKEYIEFVRPELGLDLGHNNLIQPRLVKLLGQICKLHTDPLDCVMKLDYETNGFNSDYAHPRFVAMMLRLGDLLDIDKTGPGPHHHRVRPVKGGPEPVNRVRAAPGRWRHLCFERH